MKSGVNSGIKKSKAWVEVPPTESVPGTEDDEKALLYPEWYRNKLVGRRVRGMKHRNKAVTEEGMRKKRKKK